MADTRSREQAKEEVRRRTDFVALVREYVPLRPGSAGRFMARCPFHEDGSPSFHVSPERGLFHCFGCKASGDLFAFYARAEGIGFRDALEALAERAGIELPDRAAPNPETKAERERARDAEERLRNALAVADAWFRERLSASVAERDATSRKALDELGRRGVSLELAQRYGLGVAPSSWTALGEHLQARGVSPADAEAVGLLRASKHGGYYDFFRGRIMFPIFDPRGRTIAFSGRDLLGEDETPKYLSSPETPLFRKRECVFGYSVARLAIAKENEVVLVEGNFDVLAMVAAGIPNTVAPLGTELTQEQARLLRRTCENAVVLFDSDGAGAKATHKAGETLREAGLRARVVSVSAARGKDPDELRRNVGADALRSMVRGADSWLAWALLEALEQPEAATQPGRQRLAQRLGDEASRLPEDTERAAMVRRIALRLDVHAEDLRTYVESKRPTPKPVEDAAVPAIELASGDDAVARAVAAATDQLVRSVFAHPALFAEAAIGGAIKLVAWPIAKRWLEEGRAQWTTTRALDGTALLALCGDDEVAQRYLSCVLLGAASTDTEKRDASRALLEAAKTLKKTRGGADAKVLRSKASAALAAGKIEESEALLSAAREAEQG